MKKTNIRNLLELYKAFAIVGATTFGGGYAMLPILQREIVENRGWATEEELADYYAIGQCTPGVIAVNTSTFVGYKRGGIPGAIAGSLGMVSPSIVIITIISLFLNNIAEYPAVQHALAGIRAAVCVLIFSAVLKLAKKSVKDGFSIIMFLIILLAASFIDVSPAWFVLVAGFAGYIFQPITDKEDRNKSKKKQKIDLNMPENDNLDASVEADVNEIVANETVINEFKANEEAK